jgi:hypothetical protein
MGDLPVNATLLMHKGCMRALVADLACKQQIFWHYTHTHTHTHSDMYTIYNTYHLPCELSTAAKLSISPCDHLHWRAIINYILKTSQLDFEHFQIQQIPQSYSLQYGFANSFGSRCNVVLIQAIYIPWQNTNTVRLWVSEYGDRWCPYFAAAAEILPRCSWTLAAVNCFKIIMDCSL